VSQKGGASRGIRLSEKKRNQKKRETRRGLSERGKKPDESLPSGRKRGLPEGEEKKVLQREAGGSASTCSPKDAACWRRGESSGAARNWEKEHENLPIPQKAYLSAFLRKGGSAAWRAGRQLWKRRTALPTMVSGKGFRRSCQRSRKNRKRLQNQSGQGKKKRKKRAAAEGTAAPGRERRGQTAISCHRREGQEKESLGERGFSESTGASGRIQGGARYF